MTVTIHSIINASGELDSFDNRDIWNIAKLSFQY